MRVITPRWPTASADEYTPIDCQSWNSEQPVENTDPGVCLSGKCANGAKNVKALEFTSDRFADDRNAARAENPEPFLE